MKRVGIATAVALAGILAGMQTAAASTLTFYDTESSFDAAAPGLVTTGFNGVTGLDFGDPTCPGSGACFAGFNPLVVNGITFSTTPGKTINVNSAHYYDDPGAGITDLPVQYLVNADTHFVTITLPHPVNAFGLNYGTLFDPLDVTFALSTGATTTLTFAAPGDLKIWFAGWISDIAFDQITMTVPDTTSFVIENVRTTAFAATPIPPSLLLFASALGGLGLLGWKRGTAI